MKKLILVLLTVATVFALGIPVLAAEAAPNETEVILNFERPDGNTEGGTNKPDGDNAFPDEGRKDGNDGEISISGLMPEDDGTVEVLAITSGTDLGKLPETGSNNLLAVAFFTAGLLFILVAMYQSRRARGHVYDN